VRFRQKAFYDRPVQITPRRTAFELPSHEQHQSQPRLFRRPQRCDPLCTEHRHASNLSVKATHIPMLPCASTDARLPFMNAPPDGATAPKMFATARVGLPLLLTRTFYFLSRRIIRFPPDGVCGP